MLRGIVDIVCKGGYHQELILSASKEFVDHYIDLHCPVILRSEAVQLHQTSDEAGFSETQWVTKRRRTQVQSG
ncbi:hypothetical protein R1flu_011962 [Riccia fluitans]|uniref:Uncharacterized protein n=1 Tax=Riccia fluitans TaxID=41844 RepID=A0ABD1ZA68_9MARC